MITLDPLAFDIANNIVDEREFRYRILDGKGNIVMGDNLDALDPNDANYIVTESDLEYNQWKLLSVVSINKYISRVFHALEIILVFALLGIAACLLINKKLTELLVRPIEKLTKYMRKVEKGEFGVQIENVAQGELGYLQNQFNHMNRTIKRLMEERIEREHLKRKAEIAMLTAQINPHFLYNTLNTINCIAKLEGQKSISDMVVDLGEILRYSITNSEELVPLSLEVLYLLKYCNIMNARFGGNIVLEKEIEPGLENHLMPKLLLQPIVENSFKHAFSNKSQGRIIIKASQNTGVIYVSISDDGDGIDENQCELINKSMEEMSQTEEIGLKNVNQRIKLYYGAEYGISISSQKSKGTTINLTLKGETL